MSLLTSMRAFFFLYAGLVALFMIALAPFNPMSTAEYILHGIAAYAALLIAHGLREASVAAVAMARRWILKGAPHAPATMPVKASSKPADAPPLESDIPEQPKRSALYQTASYKVLVINENDVRN